jgi:hypothetical protein
MVFMEKMLLDLEPGDKVQVYHKLCGTQTFATFQKAVRDPRGYVWVFECISCREPFYMKETPEGEPLTGFETIYVFSSPAALANIHKFARRI